MAKVSIALALLRLTVSRVHRMILWAVIAVTAIVGLVFFFMLTLQCHPVEYFWQQVRPSVQGHGHCMDLDSIINVAYVYSVTATCCDFTLGLLPVFLVWNLQMNVRTKGALAGILGMGCVYVMFPFSSTLSFLLTLKLPLIAPVQLSSFVFPISTTTKPTIFSVSGCSFPDI